MTETVNAFHVAPAGYARTYWRPLAVACGPHASYAPGCGRCSWNFEDVRVELGGDVIALILDREDGSIVEYVTTESGVEAGGLAHDGEVVILESVDFDHPAIVALASEARLYADCFGVTLSDRWPSA